MDIATIEERIRIAYYTDIPMNTYVLHMNYNPILNIPIVVIITIIS